MGCTASALLQAATADPPPADAFLDYYTLAVLHGRDVFGPILKLRSYDPGSGSYKLSVLMVCTAAEGELQLTWQQDGGAQQRANGELIESWREWRFWRFLIETTLGSAPGTLVYTVGLLPGRSFTVALPSISEQWRWAFYSCNGLDNPANKDSTGGLQPMWKDLSARHAERPFHMLLGGGDQLYNDAVFNGPELQSWDRTLDMVATAAKASIDFTDRMLNEVEEFYASHYAVHFSQPVYAEALASIPSVNIWDDHDIVDGWGSYPPLVNNSAVMQGVFQCAKKFYLLFQQHTTPDRLAADGMWCGTSQLVHVGPSLAVVTPDSRMFRTSTNIMPADFPQELQTRLDGLAASVRHLIVVLTVPILYPKLNVQQALEEVSKTLTKDPISALAQKSGLMRRITLRFGQIEIIDDLLDGWHSDAHKDEAVALIKQLQGVAASKSLRVSFLSGDVHCAGYAMLHSLDDESHLDSLRVPDAAALARDPWFMPQIISSAITNVPPPKLVLSALRKVGFVPKRFFEGVVMRFERLGQGDKEDDSLLYGQRNYAEVSMSADGANLVIALRCEKGLGSGAVEILRTLAIPALSPPSP